MRSELGVANGSLAITFDILKIVLTGCSLSDI
jgi:hypothetical protein